MLIGFLALGPHAIATQGGLRQMRVGCSPWQR